MIRALDIREHFDLQGEVHWYNYMSVTRKNVKMFFVPLHLCGDTFFVSVLLVVIFKAVSKEWMY